MMGNNPIVETMFGHDPGVALSAPRRTAIYEDTARPVYAARVGVRDNKEGGGSGGAAGSRRKHARSSHHQQRRSSSSSAAATAAVVDSRIPCHFFRTTPADFDCHQQRPLP
jgi:hypothetical protein